MEFEYDPDNSTTNEAKHGIDFEDAQTPWDDSGLLVLPSRYPDESRFLAIGSIEGQLWTAIITQRGERTRLISVRRARSAEVQLYEQNQSR